MSAVLKILIFGKKGQVARRLYQPLLLLGKVIVCGSEEVDFCNFNQLRRCIQFHNPDVIVNAAAYTNVDAAESVDNYNTVFAINTEAVKVLSEEADKLGAWLVHYSSEYVFDGEKVGSYTEDDLQHPISVYGQSKADADNFIQSFSKRYIILRTSWVFDAYGKNFAKTILNLAKSKDQLSIVGDQIGAPTSASFIANVTALLLYKVLVCDSSENNFSGIYNLTALGEVSWYGFAYSLIKTAKDLNVKLTCLPDSIVKIASSEYPVPAKRPKNSRLNTAKLSQFLKINFSNWEIFVPSLIEELKMMGMIGEL